MDAQPSQFAFTPEQLCRLQQLSAAAGKSQAEIIDELLERAEARLSNGRASQYESALEAFEAAGVIGCIDGPGDLTNPKYMEGFGRDRGGAGR